MANVHHVGNALTLGMSVVPPVGNDFLNPIVDDLEFFVVMIAGSGSEPLHTNAIDTGLYPILGVLKAGIINPLVEI